MLIAEVLPLGLQNVMLLDDGPRHAFGQFLLVIPIA